MLLACEAFVLVLVDAANVRSAAQSAIKVVSPRMVRATNHALDSAGFLYQFDSAVAADVMEHLNLAFAVAHYQERQPHEIHRFYVCVGW
ncbi:hypothetical protein D3C71_1404530 [compost metagenome]